MDAPELAKQAKKQNIIDMAVGFTGMTPLFQESSAGLIKGKLTELVEGLDRVGLEQDFRKMHREFINSFNGDILPVQYDDIMWRRLTR